MLNFIFLQNVALFAKDGSDSEDDDVSSSSDSDVSCDCDDAKCTCTVRAMFEEINETNLRLPKTGTSSQAKKTPCGSALIQEVSGTLPNSADQTPSKLTKQK